MMRFTLLAVPLFLVLACELEERPSRGREGLADTAGAAGRADTADTAGAAAAAGRAAGGAGGEAGNDSVPQSCADGSAFPSELPSRQTVTFTLHNPGSEPRYVATEGSNCETFEIASSGTSGTRWTIQRGPYYPYPGHCDMGRPFPRLIVAIAPAESASMEWDGRAFLSCPVSGFDGERSSEPARQPVPAGGYRVTIPVLSQVPADCEPSGDQEGVYECPGGGLTSCVSDLGLCTPWQADEPAPELVSSDFELPESGDIEVSVLVP